MWCSWYECCRNGSQCQSEMKRAPERKRAQEMIEKRGRERERRGGEKEKGAAEKAGRKRVRRKDGEGWKRRGEKRLLMMKSSRWIICNYSRHPLTCSDKQPALGHCCSQMISHNVAVTPTTHTHSFRLMERQRLLAHRDTMGSGQNKLRV